jgi:hypothetical protein
MVIACETNNGDDDTLLMLRREERLRGKISLWTNYSVKNSIEGSFAKVSSSIIYSYIQKSNLRKIQSQKLDTGLPFMSRIISPNFFNQR